MTLWSIVVLPALILAHLTRRRFKPAALLAVFAAAGFLIPNLIVLSYAGADGLLFPWKMQTGRLPTFETVWYFVARHTQAPASLYQFGPPGYAYVYRSYGIHWCVNFVCEAEGQASAVLIRALRPTHGTAAMKQRRGLDDERLLCAGPGRLCQALGITHAQNGMRLDRAPFELRAPAERPEIARGIRIGISKAADLPWRYGLKDSKFLRKPFR